jgi:hypothetical protein
VGRGVRQGFGALRGLDRIPVIGHDETPESDPVAKPVESVVTLFPGAHGAIAA